MNQSATNQGKTYLLFIGVETLPNSNQSSHNLAQLKYRASDCQKIADTFKELYPYIYELFILHDGDNISSDCKISDQKFSPTFEFVTRVINDITSNAEREDTILIYITGHGILLNDNRYLPNNQEKNQAKTYICLQDTEITKEGNYDKILSLDDLVNKCIESNFREIILIIDTCHSGNLNYQTKQIKDKFYALVSCKSHQSSSEEETLNSSLFSYYLLLGLQGNAPKNEQGFINADNLFEYVYDSIKWHQSKIENERYRINLCLKNKKCQELGPDGIQTPDRYAKGTTPVLSQPKYLPDKPLRQAFMVTPTLNFFVDVLTKQANFRVSRLEWDNHDTLLKIIKSYLSKDFYKPSNTILLYLQGKLDQELKNFSLQNSDRQEISLSFENFKDVINHSQSCHLILIFNCINATKEQVKKWIQKLGQCNRENGLAIFGITAQETTPLLSIHKFSEIVVKSHKNKGLTAGELSQCITKDTELKDKVDYWLSGNRAIIEIIPYNFTSKDFIYIDRPQLKEKCLSQIELGQGITTITGPRSIGKKTFLRQLKTQFDALNYLTIIVDLDSAQTYILEDYSKFLEWFANQIRDKLKEKNIEITRTYKEFKENETKNQPSDNELIESYFFDDILASISSRVFVLIIQRIDRIYDCEFAKDFLRLLRSWYNETKDSTPWRWNSLRLLLMYSTECYVKLDPRESPFNPENEIKIDEFTPQEVVQLVQAHNIEINESQRNKIVELVGCHPYLITTIIDEIKRNLSGESPKIFDEIVSLQSLLEIFQKHLNDISDKVTEPNNKDKYDMLNMLRDLSKDQNIRKNDKNEIIFLKLSGIGLVILDDQSIKFRNELYKKYVKDKMLNSV
jgi:uncharacterized caspase-like protein